MIWKILDKVQAEGLSVRYSEFRDLLSKCSTDDLTRILVDLEQIQDQLYSPKLATLFAIKFVGEANWSGFIDFCSNIVIKGKFFYEMMTESDEPQFLENEFLNDEFGIPVKTLVEHEFEIRGINIKTTDYLKIEKDLVDCGISSIAIVNEELAIKWYPKLFASYLKPTMEFKTSPDEGGFFNGPPPWRK